MSSNKLKLTDAIVARSSLPEDKQDYTLWDTEATGFGLRMRPNSQSWIVCYRPSGAGRSATMRRVKIGTPATIRTVAEARRIAFTLLGKVASGQDPAVERAENRRRQKARVRDLLDRYEKHLIKRHYVARAMVMSLLRSRLFAHLDTDVKRVSGQDIAGIVDQLEGDGLSGAAEAFRSRVRTFLQWCVTGAKVIEQNPAVGQRRGRSTRAERLKREEHGKALTDAQVAAIWKAADNGTAFGRLVQFLILTGTRRNEAAGMSREMVGRSPTGRAVIVIPPELTKQGREHVLPITPSLRALLRRCEVDARSARLFPSSRTGGSISGWTKFKADLVRRSSVEFRLHDLRRTMRTGLSRLGVPADIAELCIGHQRSGLEKIYNRDQCEREVRIAFLRWSKHLRSFSKECAA